MAPRLVTFVMWQRMCPFVARGRPHETSLGSHGGGFTGVGGCFPWGVPVRMARKVISTLHMLTRTENMGHTGS